jgi:thiol-disulfide isomerase/thioredoxin
MRFLAVLVLLLAAAVGYSYFRNPAACIRVAHDLTPMGDSSHLARDLGSVIDSTTGDTLKKIPILSALAPAPAPTPIPVWTPPAVLPEQPDWTWTTISGEVYHNVKVYKVDADYVTATYSEGGGQIPLSSLPPDLQRLFNYTPALGTPAAVAASATSATEQAPPPAVFDPNLSFSQAMAQAKASNKLLLLHFTGSDWCPYCQYLDHEVISTSSFQKFSAENFVFVTLDFPHSTSLPQDVKDQNEGLSRRYNITGFPSLLVADVDGRELGCIAGYAPGSGPDAVIANLRQIVKR